MDSWLKLSCLLCVFGFIREIRPSEPYITEFLLGEWKNVTSEEVNRDVFPIGTYSYMAQLVVVFLITDFLRYKPLIVTVGVAGVIVWSMLLWTTSLLALQVLEVFYGTYMAAEIAYFTYIYAKVDKKHYPKVTSHTRAAMLAGKLVASVLAQILLNSKLLNYRDLNYITLGSQIFATIWALSLPSVKSSIYFHRKTSPNGTSTLDVNLEANSTETMAFDNSRLTAFQLLWMHFRNAYTNVKVVQWSIWYSVGICGYYQAISYIQVLWKHIEPEPLTAWNGAVDAILTLLGTIFALIAGYVHAGRFNPRGSLIALAILSILEGASLVMCCWTSNIFVSYAGYIIFGALYAFTITVSSSEVARYLEEESFGLVFGFNTWIALLLQSLLTIVVVSEAGLALTVVGQYFVYASYFIVIGAVYFIFLVVEYFVTKQRGE